MERAELAREDTGRLIRLAAKMAWNWTVPPDPALEKEDLYQEAILYALKAQGSWKPERGMPFERYVMWIVRRRLLFISARANPKRRTQGKRYHDDDPRRERMIRFSEIETVSGEPWEPRQPVADALTLMQRAFLVAAIDQLPARQQLILARVLLEGHEVREIAADLRLGENTAYRDKKEGLQAIWRALYDEEPDMTRRTYTGTKPTSHCPRGHLRAGDNLSRNGACKACARERAKERYQSRRRNDVA